MMIFVLVISDVEDIQDSGKSCKKSSKEHLKTGLTNFSTPEDRMNNQAFESTDNNKRTKEHTKLRYVIDKALVGIEAWKIMLMHEIIQTLALDKILKPIKHSFQQQLYINKNTDDGDEAFKKRIVLQKVCTNLDFLLENTMDEKNFQSNLGSSYFFLFISLSTFPFYNPISIKPYLWDLLQARKFRKLKEKRSQKNLWNINSDNTGMMLVTTNKNKLMADTIEIVRIRNDYEDVLFKRPRKRETCYFSTSRYIKINCPYSQNYSTNSVSKCKCIEQEEMLNLSLKQVPKEISQCNPELISNEFTPQILSWANTDYKCTPCLRSSTKMIATSDFLFIFGGSNPNISKKALQDVYRFNILTREWSKLNAKNIPASLICYTICYDPNPHEKHLIGYIFGGAYDPDGSKMSNKLYKFYINVEGSIRFQELNIEGSEDNKPSPRCGSSLTMSQTGKLYLIGGADEKCYLSDIWVLDTTNGKLCWEKIEQKNQIRGRYTHGTALIHENILLLGGGDGDWSACFDQIVTFDISIQQFITISTLPDDIYGYPHARQFHSYVTNGDEVYIIGGWAKNKPEMSSSSDIEDFVLFKDIWKLYPIKMGDEICFKWKKVSTSLKMPLFFHTSAITPEGCVYTFGGCIDGKSMYPSNKLQRFWIKPPELKQIAMFQILANNPKIVADFKQHEIKRLLAEKEKNKKNLGSTVENNKQTSEQNNAIKETNIENSDDIQYFNNGIDQSISDCGMRELRQTVPMRLVRRL